jgi:hypothetical protein
MTTTTTAQQRSNPRPLWQAWGIVARDPLVPPAAPAPVPAA